MKAFTLKALVILLLVVTFCAAKICAQVVPNTSFAKAANSNGNGASFDITTFTIPPGVNVLLLVAVRNEDSRVVSTISVTYNNNTYQLTPYYSVPVTNGSNAQIYYRLMGNITTTLNSEIDITLSGNTQQKIATAITYQNVNQSTPLSGFTYTIFGQGATSSTLSLGAANGDYAYDAISGYHNNSSPPVFTVGPGQTFIAGKNSSTNPDTQLSSGQEPCTGGTTTMSWTVANITGTSGIHIAGAVKVDIALLPVELTHFNVENASQKAVLNWATASETNNRGFMVQRSLNGSEWDDLLFVPGRGTSTELQTYNAVDEKPFPGLNYYRLRQKDFDGNVDFSHVVSLEFNTDEEGLNLFPNPAPSGKFSMRLPSNAGTSITTTVHIFNSQGTVVHRLLFQDDGFQSTSTTIDLNHLPVGVYVVQAKNGHKIWTGKLLID